MIKMTFLVIPVFILTILIGCSNEKRELELEKYKATGVIESVEKTNAEVDGFKLDYSVQLSKLESSSNPDPNSNSTFHFSITKNSVITISTDEKNSKADSSSLEKGKLAEVTWRFATDHVVEAIEVNIK